MYNLVITLDFKICLTVKYFEVCNYTIHYVYIHEDIIGFKEPRL